MDKIRASFSETNAKAVEYDPPAEPIKNALQDFKPLNCLEIEKKNILKSASEQCELDPIPTPIVKNCISKLTV